MSSCFDDLISYAQRKMTVGQYYAFINSAVVIKLQENYYARDVDEIAWEIAKLIDADNAERICLQFYFRPHTWTKVLQCGRCGWMPVREDMKSCPWCHHMSQVFGEGVGSDLEKGAGGLSLGSPLPRFYQRRSYGNY